MVSIITSISLDPETASIKDRLIASYGFSKWIRECLRRYAAEQGEAQHSQDEEGRVRGLCNGLLVPHCRVCWPEGPPSREGWIDWRMGSETKPEPRVAHFALPKAPTEKKRQQTPGRNNPGLLTRFYRWLI
jgi:hypothetical protein